MRIAYFVKKFPLISETFILRQITGMIDRGHDVRIFATALVESDVVHSDVEKYRLAARTTVRSVVPARFLHRILPALRVLLKALITGQLKIALRAMNIARFGRRAIGLHLLVGMECFLDNNEFDILHCQFGSVAPAVLTMKKLGVLSGALVSSYRGFDITEYPIKNPGCYAELFADGDAFLPVSDSLRQLLVKQGCPPARTEIHHSGINLTKFPFRGCQNIRRPVRIVSVARLAEKKGIEYALRAVQRVVESGYEADYRIAGTGPLESSLHSLTEQLGLTGHVEFLGALEFGAVVELLEDADIFILPSVTSSDGSQEGIPNALKEAMAIGVPVVATFHGGIPELVNDRVSGFLAAEKDDEGLAVGLMHIIDNWADMAPILNAARHEVETSFDIELLNDTLVGTYARLAAKSA